MSDFV